MDNKAGLLILMLAMLGAMALPSPATRKDDQAELQANLQRWRSMSEAERSGVRERYRAWKGMSDSERESVRENYRRFRKYDPEAQASLTTAYEQNFTKMKAKQRAELNRRLVRLRKLAQRKRQRAMAVGWFMHEGREQGWLRMNNMPPQRRHRMLRALRDIFIEMRPEDRQHLISLPNNKKRQLIRRLMQEKRARFHQAFQEKYGDLQQEILRQLTPQEKRIYRQMPPQLKLKLFGRVSKQPDPEKQLKMVRHLLRRYQRQMRERKRREQDPKRDRKRRERQDDRPRDG